MANSTNCDEAGVSHSLADSQPKFDEQSKSELLAHVQLFLSSMGFHKSANLLADEIDENALVPTRLDINGVPCKQSFDQYIRRNRNYAGNLVDFIVRLNELSCQVVPPVVPNLPIRLFASKRQSLTRKIDVLEKAVRVDEAICRRPVISSLERISVPHLLMARQLGGQMPHPRRLMLRKESVENLQLHRRIFGHLGPIFCVKFDVTGRYIFTGADDNLIKVWNANTCLLRYTFRGHTGYITDMAISPENNVLASGSTDKTVRIWCLQRGKLLHVNKQHTASITTITFLPYMKGNVRYLVSAGSDCLVIFHRYDAPNDFRDKPPTSFDERTKPGVKLISICHSPGGNLVAVGDTHRCIRLYQVFDNNVERLFQVSAHMDRVDSLIWAHKHLRFVSGSKDGTAKAWFIGDKGWCSSSFKVPKTVFSKNASPLNVMPHQRLLNDYPTQQNGAHYVHCQLQTKKNTYRVTMLCWSHDDDIVVSSGSDNLLRTWNWKTGDMLRILNGHTDEAYVLLAHPVYREYVLSVGHDARLIVWNIYTGKAVNIHHNNTDNETNEKRAIFDMSISSDGTLVSFVDNYGNLSILGVNSNEPAKKVPREQFFITDYRTLAMDDEGFVLDEASGLAPHNMDPPTFVSGDGVPHAEEWQRRIPGHDVLSSDYGLICPWVNRQVVPELTESSRTRILTEWEFTSEEEMKNIQSLSNSVAEINPEHRQLVPRPRRPGGGATSRLNATEQMRNGLMNPSPNVPRYFIEEEYNDSDNDPSYTGDGSSYHGPSSRRSSPMEDDNIEDDMDSDEYEPTSSMRLRARQGRRLRRRFEEPAEGTDGSDTVPVRRSTRRHVQNAFLYTSDGLSPTPEGDPNSQISPIGGDIAQRTRSCRRAAAENIRKTSQSSRENVSNEDEPCCSNTLSQNVRQSNLGDNAETTVDEPTTSAATVEEPTSTAISSQTDDTHRIEDESSAGEECHESDNTYKNDSLSSHAEEDEAEVDEEEGIEEEVQPTRIRRIFYSPPEIDELEETPSSSNSSSPSSSSCYSSGRKTRRVPQPKGRRRAKQPTRTPAATKRKAQPQSDSSAGEAKRPRRAAANNALNRFRESSEFEDDDGVFDGQYKVIKTTKRRRVNTRRRIDSSSAEREVPHTRSRKPTQKVHLPPKTRAGRNVIPTERYRDSD